MVQSYQGYFTGEGFVTDERKRIKIPTNRQVTVSWDEGLSEKEADIKKQLEAFERFVEANRALNEQGIELLDEEWDKMIEQGVELAREIDWE